MFKTTVEMQRRKRVIVWLYGYALVLLARLGLVNHDEAYRRVGQRMLDSMVYRVGRAGRWERLDMTIVVHGDGYGGMDVAVHR